MNRILSLLVLFIFAFSGCTKQNTLVEFNAGNFRIGIDKQGFVNQLTDTESKTDYISNDTIAPLLSCRINGKFFYPVSASIEENFLIVQFDGNRNAKVKVEEKPTHLTFELLEFNSPDTVDLIAWGPFPTSIKKSIGETVGVVRGDDFAIGIQALNIKTLGGYPWTDNDCMPQFDIFEQDDYSDLSEENKRETLYRVEAAKPEKFGSTLQAYCRNRNKERIIENLSHEKYISPKYEDGGIIGSKIALFGCPVDETLKTIGKIEIAENLPHPTIDGNWGKMAHTASAAYLIFDFSEKNIDEAIAYVKKAGLSYLYHSGPFATWGHFELNKTQFPHGWDGLKMCVEKAEKEGIHVGVHTLSNFTTTNDAYVTPVPDSRLGIVGSSVLSEKVDAKQTEIPIQSPDFFAQYQNNNLHTVMVGEELIRYETVSETAPWKLLNCERGAWNTKAYSHANGKKISMLVDHGYKVFLTNPELSIEEAERIADLFNYCGLRQISFDGLEGNRSTGMGNYGEILFTTSWWNNLSEEIKQHTIIDASRTSHYFWHIYSRMNWGEPWYAGFRESQTAYRLKNQAYFQRKLMPGMLGWFSMRDNTPVEDIEWMLARSAAFNAGYAFVTGDKALKTNGQTDEIFRLIGEWENARMENAFTEEQKERMKDVNNEFHLETTGEKIWELSQVYSFKFKHEAKEKQPGEPSFSTFKFNNFADGAMMQFILTAQDATISGIKLELDNSRQIPLQFSLKKGEYAKFSGENHIQIYDAWNHEIKEIPINNSLFKLVFGEHSVNFDCTFSEKGKEPGVKFEVRIEGKGEEIKASPRSSKEGQI